MIYPRLDKVRNGQRMSVELVNGLIKRTEYAADLLQKYRILNGIKAYKGTTISLGAISPGGATDDFGFGFVTPNKIYTFPPFTAEPGELLGPGINITKATSGRLVITGGAWEHGVTAPDDGFVQSYGSGSTLTLPIPYGVRFVGWISCGFGPSFPFTGGTIQWVTD